MLILLNDFYISVDASSENLLVHQDNFPHLMIFWYSSHLHAHLTSCKKKNKSHFVKWTTINTFLNEQKILVQKID